MLSEIICEKRSYSKNMDKHHHKFGQMILPITGELQIKTKSNECCIDKNHFFYVPMESDHSFSSEIKNEFLVLDIPRNIDTISEKIKSNKQELMFFDERWKALRFLFLQESKRMDKRGTRKLVEYAFEIINEEIKSTSKSIEYINSNLHEKLTVSKLASLENFSESYYIEWFQKKTGYTPNEYIQIKRVEKAKELLQRSEYSLAVISSIVGYDYQSSLTRIFKRHEGISPLQFRRSIVNMDKNIRE